MTDDIFQPDRRQMDGPAPWPLPDCRQCGLRVMLADPAACGMCRECQDDYDAAIRDGDAAGEPAGCK